MHLFISRKVARQNQWWQSANIDSFVCRVLHMLCLSLHHQCEWDANVIPPTNVIQSFLATGVPTRSLFRMKLTNVCNFGSKSHVCMFKCILSIIPINNFIKLTPILDMLKFHVQIIEIHKNLKTIHNTRSKSTYFKTNRRVYIKNRHIFQLGCREQFILIEIKNAFSFWLQYHFLSKGVRNWANIYTDFLCPPPRSCIAGWHIYCLDHYVHPCVHLYVHPSS